MGCKKLYIKEYKGDIVMSRQRNNQRQSTNTNTAANQTNGQVDTNQQTNGESEENTIKGYIVPKPILIFLITMAVSVIGWFIVWQITNINDIKSELGKNSAQIDSLDNNINNINDDIKNINVILNGEPNEDGLCTRLAVLEKLIDIDVISVSSNVTTSVREVSLEPNDTNLVNSNFKSDTYIGTDSNGNQYIAEDLINQKVLLTYTENGKEIYFLGQYNENYNWNGYCIINSYNSDGTLFSICESNFENGKRLDYKSFYKDSDEWIYTDRVCGDNNNTGVSISYNLIYEKVKNFTNTNVRITDILYVDKFIAIINPTMLSYYYGKTSNLLFNDTTGEAYYVSYFEDGTIKTLYQGNFVDGKFNDTTGNAWYIAKEKNTNYMYAKGNFKENTCIDGDDAFENPVDLNRINEIIKDKYFECELKWAGY